MGTVFFICKHCMSIRNIRLQVGFYLRESGANRAETTNQGDTSDIFNTSNTPDTLDASRQLVSIQDLFTVIWFLGFCTILFISTHTKSLCIVGIPRPNIVSVYHVIEHSLLQNHMNFREDIRYNIYIKKLECF
jgi:hypothetical protein